MEAASPPLTPRRGATAAGYGAAPPASRVATAIATRRPCGPPLTPEPLRPLTRSGTGQGQQPLPTEEPRRSTAPHSSKSLQTKSLQFQGIATVPTVGERLPIRRVIGLRAQRP